VVLRFRVLNFATESPKKASRHKMPGLTVA